MKLGWFGGALMLGLFVGACAGPSNGGWVTKGGWDAASRAAPEQPAPVAKDSRTIHELDQNPYPDETNGRPAPVAKDSRTIRELDQNPYPDEPNEPKAKSTKPLKADDVGF